MKSRRRSGQRGSAKYQALRVAAERRLEQCALRYGFGRPQSLRPLQRLAADRRLDNVQRAEAFVLLGNLYGDAERYRLAQNAYDRAIQFNPHRRNEVLIHKATCTWLAILNQLRGLFASSRPSSRDPIWHQVFYWMSRLDVETLAYDPDGLADVLRQIPREVLNDRAVANDVARCKRLIRFWRQK